VNWTAITEYINIELIYRGGSWRWRLGRSPP